MTLIKLLSLIVFISNYTLGSCLVYGWDKNTPDYLCSQDYPDFSSGHLEKYYIDTALKAFRLSDYKNAIRNFNMALSFNKRNPIPWQYIGIINFREDMYEDAVKMLEESIRLYPDSFEANFYIGKSLEKLRNTDKALMYYQKAVRINPRIKEGYSRIFEMYKEKRDYLAIIKYGKSMLDFKLPPYLSSYIYMWIGYAYIYLGDYNLAITNLNYSRGLKKNNTPDYAWVSGLIDVLNAKKTYIYDGDKEVLKEIDQILGEIIAKDKLKYK